MIKINLTPVDELDSRFFYLAELAILLIVGVSGYMGVDHYLQNVRDKIQQQTIIESEKRVAIDKLKSDLVKFSSLNDDISNLNRRLEALKKITVSRISKYKPVIVLEHLQNLRPEGVWYTSFRNQEDQVTLNGVAFDNILVAELLMALRSTESQEADSSDLRTQVYFNNLNLAFSKLGSDPDFAELQDFPMFEISMRFAEKIAVERAIDSGMPLSDKDIHGRKVF